MFDLVGIVSPGMIRRGDRPRVVKPRCAIHLFGCNDLGLLGLAVVCGIGQGFTLVEDGDLAVEIHRHRDDCLSHAVGGAIDLDLVDEVVEL